LRSHLLKRGFQVTSVEPAEMEKLEEEGQCRFVIGVLDGSGAGRLSALVNDIRQRPVCKALPLLALVPQDHLKELETIQGLEDFLPIPAAPEGVESRVRFVLKRLNHPAPGAGIRIGALEINPDRYEVALDGEPLELTYKEFELLKFLATHPSRVFSRDQLLNRVWGYNFIGGTRTVDVHVRRLRAKLGPKYAALIDTVRNVGYKFLESL
jgi:DNA-binding response OmpR family regulator